MFCTDCGNEIKEGSLFCPHCGAKLTGVNVSGSGPVQPMLGPAQPLPPGAPVGDREPKTLLHVLVGAVVVLLLVVIAAGAFLVARHFKSAKDEETEVSSEDSSRSRRNRDRDTEDDMDEERAAETEEEAEEEEGFDLGQTPLLSGILGVITEEAAWDSSYWDRLLMGEEGAIRALVSRGSMRDEAIGSKIYELSETVTEEGVDLVYTKDTLSNLLSSLTGRQLNLDWLAGDFTQESSEGGSMAGSENWQTKSVGKDTWEISADGYRYQGDGTDGGGVYYKSVQVTFTVKKDPESLFDGYCIEDAKVVESVPYGWAWDYANYLMNMMQSDYDGFWERSFDLIYLDEDDIPELVVGQEGYWVSVYTWHNGIETVMDPWGYNAGGNFGYEYLPRTGIVYNAGSGYAGAIRYEYYRKLSEDGLEPLLEIRRDCFVDKNGNGEPDQEDDYDSTGPIYVYDEAAEEYVEISEQEVSELYRQAGISENESWESIGFDGEEYFEISEELSSMIEYQ